MTKTASAFSVFFFLATMFGQSQDKLAIRVTPYRGKTPAASSVYIADYIGSEFMFEGMILPSAKDATPKLMFNCRVEIRRGENWELLKANWTGAEPTVMKEKTEGGLPSACRFILPKEGGKVGDCIRIVFRSDWLSSARTFISEPFSIEAKASSVRGCKP